MEAQGGCDTADVQFSKATAMMFGVLGKDGHHIRVADAWTLTHP